MVVSRIEKEYDALVGRPIRKIRVNDIVHLAAKHGQYSAGTMNFTALDADTELFITGFGVSSSIAGNDFYVTIGNSTILPVRVATNASASFIGTRDAPLAKAAANSTISIAVGSAGTSAAWLSGVREPTFANVETI